MKKINWPITFALIVVHMFALLGGVLFYSWEGLAIGSLLYAITALGITVGFHRYLTHNGFETYWPIRCLLLTAGSLAGQGPAIGWVVDHRLHHQFSDKEGDPHSPEHGAWHSHMLWLFGLDRTKDRQSLYQQYAPDLCDERLMCNFGAAYPFLHIGMILLLAGAGYAYGHWYYALSFVAYGFFVRMVCVFHATWMVNSVTHIWGYRNYETRDRSTNNWFVAALTFGEGWHNNHHAYPVLAMHGYHKKGEHDPSYWVIKSLQRCGLVWNVKDELPQKTS